MARAGTTTKKSRALKKSRSLGVREFLQLASADDATYEQNLKNLQRAVREIRAPRGKNIALVLEGPPASGKTLLQEFLWGIDGPGADRVSVHHLVTETPRGKSPKGLLVLRVVLRRYEMPITIEFIEQARLLRKVERSEVESLMIEEDDIPW